MAAVEIVEREVRLGLVMNGGVSLAVWIGGVTYEIDAARRARSAGGGPETEIYGQILAALHDEVVVDVIAGASAGGINGVLLGAAVFNGKPLPDLRSTWIALGDFPTLLRKGNDPDPRSLMDGDGVVLAKLNEKLGEVYAGTPAELTRPLYVYVTATDLFGRPHVFGDSLGREFMELDYRRVFSFQHEPGELLPAEPAGKMRPVVDLAAADAPGLLANAARASSSFPVAFEAHAIATVSGDNEQRWYVDGGILDNQPFNPVLDRISILKSDTLVKRVVTYVVPYVTNPGVLPTPSVEQATALRTYSAAGSLPRDLPKMQSLERVTQEHDAQARAEELRRTLRPTLSGTRLRDAATALHASYLETRLATSLGLFQLWATSGDQPGSFHPGDGVSAQSPADDPPSLDPPPPGAVDAAHALNAAEPLAWLAPGATWSATDPTWQWGLSPGERTAAWALLFLRDAIGHARRNGSAIDRLQLARARASGLVRSLRACKPLLYQTFLTQSGASLAARAKAAYGVEAVASALGSIQTDFADLDRLIGEANAALPAGDLPVPGVATLLHLEIVRNALTINEESVPFPFEFVFASAGIANSLGHQASTPSAKLAGMKLNHFGGFLKSSWRANDWLWGRLDGVEHVLRAVLDSERIVEVDAAAALSAVAFPADGPERAVLVEVWARTLADLQLEAMADPDPAVSFRNLLAPQDPPLPAAKVEQRLEACRRALAARVQLRIVGSELPDLVRLALDDVHNGSPATTLGAVWAQSVPPANVPSVLGGAHEPLTPAAAYDLFKRLMIGTETLGGEAGTRPLHAIEYKAAAAALALFSKQGGGLPEFGQKTLRTLRRPILAVLKVLLPLVRL